MRTCTVLTVLLTTAAEAPAQFSAQHPPAPSPPSLTSSAAPGGPSQQIGFPCGQYDDGSTENALGLTAGGEIGWMHAFDCLGVIDGVETAYGTLGGFPGSCGTNSKIGLWVDLDCDDDPTTGMQLLEVVQTVTVNCDTDILNLVPFTQPHVISSGCAWVAASADHVAGEFPGPMDQDNPTPAAWVVGSTLGPGTLDYADLNANNIPPMQMDAIGFPAAWLLRANAGPLDCGDGVTLCYGNGTGAPCGCGNETPPNACAGCENGLGVGAQLGGTGVPSLSNDTVVVTATEVTAQPGLMFQGDVILGGGAGATFGDGIRCCGQNLIRLEVLFGQPPEPTSVSTSIVISQHPGQNLSPGDKRCYQYWYRDPRGTPCGSGFNFTNALLITWEP